MDSTSLALPNPDLSHVDYLYFHSNLKNSYTSSIEECNYINLGVFLSFHVARKSKYLIWVLYSDHIVLKYSIFVSSCLCLCFSIFILMIFLYISLLGKKVEHKYVNIHTLKIHCMFLGSIEEHSCLRWTM